MHHFQQFSFDNKFLLGRKSKYPKLICIDITNLLSSSSRLHEPKIRFHSSYSYFLTNSTRIPNILIKIDSEKNSGFAPTKSEKYKKMYFYLLLDNFFLLMLYNCLEMNVELTYSVCPTFEHA